MARSVASRCFLDGFFRNLESLRTWTYGNMKERSVKREYGFEFFKNLSGPGKEAEVVRPF